MSEQKIVRIPVVNPEEGVDIRIQRSRTLKQEKEAQDGNQFYIVHSEGGITAADSDEREDILLDKLLDVFGVDEILKLRIKFIKIPDNPSLVFDHVEGIIDTTETDHVLPDGTPVKGVETDARYIKFPGTNDSIQLVKVNKSIFDLCIKE